MNNKLRKSLNKAKQLVVDAMHVVEDVRDDEYDSLNNIPENLESSDMYIAKESAAESLDSAYEALEESLNYICEAIA